MFLQNKLEMEFVLVADPCYPYIAKCRCQKCGRQFLAEYTDESVRLFGSVCDCESDSIPEEGYPSYSEWKQLRSSWLEKHSKHDGVNVSISPLRNELYVYFGEQQIFQVNGYETGEDFSEMSEAEGLAYILENYGDVLADFAE